MRIFYIIILGLLFSACAPVQTGSDKEHNSVPTETELAIINLLTVQAEAWNRGDIDAFMQSYWRDEALRFASGGRVVRGWQPTLERYKRRYSDRALMGTLTFSDLEIVHLSEDAAITHGRWSLDRAENPVGGLFTLVMRYRDDNWVIISDTTTLDRSE